VDKDELWQAVLGELEVTLSKASFTTWFKDTFLAEISPDRAIVAVPNGFAKEWLEKKYATDIAKALQKYSPGLATISFRVATKEPAPTPQLALPNVVGTAPVVHQVPSSPAPDTLNPRYVFEQFVVGNSNRLAHAAAVAVSQNPGTLHNPLFLYGGVGLGKTHLAHAIGHEVRRLTPKKRVLYVDCEQFTSEFVLALRSNTMDRFKKKYRDIDVFLVDDIQFLSAKEGTQEEFFHTFNALHQRSRQIVLTSDRVPKAIPQLEERLSSRFGWGLVADIQPPNFEMRVAILRNKAHERQFTIGDEVINFLAEHVQSNIRDLEGVLNRLQGWCQLHGVTPTVEIANEMVSGFLGKPDLRHLSPLQVLSVVGHFYQVAPEDLLSPRRTADLVLPRQLAMFFMRTELGLSFPRIGQEIGGKDHTTVMHGVTRIEKEKERNEKLREDIGVLRERLYGRG
jgi:chromosomal replication initiator protein